MRNDIFKKLLEKFGTEDLQKLSQIPGFLDARNTLTELVNLVEENQNLSKEDYEKSKKAVKEKFNQFKENCNVILGNDRKSIPDEFQKIFTAIKGVQRPLDSYIKNLNEDKTINEAFSDTSWLDGLFENIKVPERPDYVPGQFSVEGKTDKEIVDLYKNDFKEVRNNYVSHMSKLVGDDFDPDGMFDYKIELMQSVLNSYEEETNTYDLYDMMSSAHKELNFRILGKEGAPEVTDIKLKYIMSDAFFTAMEGDFIDGGNLQGALYEQEHIKTKDSKTLELIIKETEKLLPKARNIGMSKEMLERFYETSYKIYRTVKPLELFADNFDEPNEDEPYYDFFVQAYKLKMDMLDYLNGSISDNPVNVDVINNLSKQFEEILKETPVFKNNEFSKDLFAFVDIFNGVVDLFEIPEEKKNALLNEAKSRVIKEIDKANEELFSNGKYSETDVKKAFIDSQKAGFISPDDLNERVYIRMANDPEYNKQQMEIAMKAIKEYADCENADNLFDRIDSNYFPSNNPLTGKKFTEQEAYSQAYKLLMVGNKINIQNAKREAARKQGGNEVNELKDINKGLKCISEHKLSYDDQKKFIHQISKNIDNNKSYVALTTLKPSQVLHFIKNEKNFLTNIDRDFSELQNNLLDGLDDKTIGFLIQKKASLNKTNSPSYEAMSNALKVIYEKGKNGVEPTMEDYRKLYEKCSSYVDSHETNPFFDNGKKRIDAALSIMDKLGPKLSKEFPDMASSIKEDKLVNMVRNDRYREKEKNRTIEWVKNVSEKMIKQNIPFSKLPENRKNEFVDNCRLAFNNEYIDYIEKDYNFIGLKEGKCNADKRSMIVKRFDLGDKVSTYFTKELENNFEKAISKIVPTENPEIKKEDNVMTGNWTVI